MRYGSGSGAAALVSSVPGKVEASDERDECVFAARVR